LKRLNEMSELLTQANSLNEIANITSEKTVELFQSQFARLYLINAESENAEILAEAGEVSETYPTNESIWDGPLGEVVRQKRLIVDEVRGDGEGATYRSEMMAPIIVGGELICAISVGIEGDYLFTSTDQNMLAQITSLLAGTLENSRLFTQIQRRSTQLQAAANVSRMAGGILDSAELLQNVIEAIREGFDLYYTGIFLVDQTGE
jgi:GAF domain-containing protein